MLFALGAGVATFFYAQTQKSEAPAPIPTTQVVVAARDSKDRRGARADPRTDAVRLRDPDGRGDGRAHRLSNRVGREHLVPSPRAEGRQGYGHDRRDVPNRPAGSQDPDPGEDHAVAGRSSFQASRTRSRVRSRSPSFTMTVSAAARKRSSLS